MLRDWKSHRYPKVCLRTGMQYQVRYPRAFLDYLPASGLSNDESFPRILVQILQDWLALKASWDQTAGLSRKDCSIVRTDPV